MNRYDIKVNFNSADGKISIMADTESEAIDMVLDDIGERLAKAFPELDIEYDVEVDEVWTGGDPDMVYEIKKDIELMQLDY